MKTNCFSRLMGLLPIIMLISLLIGCHDNVPSCTPCENSSDAFVIGYDPCTGVLEPNGGNVGFIISVPSQKDTSVTYNFPTGIYEFPEEYFSYYQYYSFFPDSALDDFPIKLKYRSAKQNEKEYPICRGDILTGYFDQEKQIVILSINKP